MVYDSQHVYVLFGDDLVLNQCPCEHLLYSVQNVI